MFPAGGSAFSRRDAIAVTIEGLIAIPANIPTEFVLDLEQAELEIDSLLNRIANRLNYFGNPVGWVPLLSLEATLLTFHSEVDHALPLLYWSHLL